MLESIYIENFAIIDRLEVSFHDQMTVLTGETGAGKSIIIDAIGQLMGNRSQTSFIKSGCNESFIEGIFTIKDNSSVLNKCILSLKSLLNSSTNSFSISFFT